MPVPNSLRGNKNQGLIQEYLGSETAQLLAAPAPTYFTISHQPTKPILAIPSEIDTVIKLWELDYDIQTVSDHCAK
ncbi:MAG: hypothetical protein R2788_12810 [Saprospiraceae bacterium]